MVLTFFKNACFVMLNASLSFQTTFGMATFFVLADKKRFCANEDLVAFW